jgi:hypothetical protein
LKYDKPLTQKDQGALNGLEALGLIAKGRLTRWGEFFIKGEGAIPTPKPAKPCQIHNDRFFVSLPQHTDLLWELEKYICPAFPGCYPLTRRALHFYEGNPYELIALLERGLQGVISERIKAAILKQPSIRIASGIVLEFSSPTAFRSNGLDICLPSPGHVFRSLWEKWNAFAPEPMQLHDLWPQFANDCILVDELTIVNTVYWEFAEGSRGSATGYTGTVGFTLIPKGRVKKEWQEYWDGASTVLQSLARYSFYCGVGHHTTIGMGQTRELGKSP